MFLRSMLSEFVCNAVGLLQLNDMGHYAEALMTKGVLARRGSMEQLKVRTSCLK